MSIILQDFRKTLTYTATASAEQISQDLNQITELDQEAERKKQKFSLLTGIAALGAFVSLFLIAGFPQAGILFLLGFSIAAIVSGILLNKYGRLDVPNYRYELPLKVVSMLNRDIEENTTIHINLIFTPPTQTNKQVSTGDHPYRQGWKVQLFKDSWCSIKGGFSDKNQFQLILSDFYRIASGRNSRGKYKSKTKPKGTEFFLKLNYNQQRYGAIQVLKEDAKAAIKLPEGVIPKGLTITKKAIQLKVNVSPEISNNPEVLYQTISMMFLSLYQILNLARMLSKTK